jgi:DNA mismatch repair protein MutS
MTTPIMQQYQDAKDKHPGMLLLFRIGDFYEFFHDDAKLISQILGLTLTSRDKLIPMAGFPHHALQPHLQKLLQAGHRVAICDQVEDASQAKGLVRREVTRVVTPGTVTEDDLLDPRGSNYLAALARGPDPTQCGLAWLELTTGQFQAMDVAMTRLPDELARLGPAECLCPEQDAGRVAEIFTRLNRPPALTPQPDWTFAPTTARTVLEAHFHVATMVGFGFEDQQPCLTAAGALLQYVQEMLKANLTHVRRLQPFVSSRFLQLDEVTRRSLELTRTLRDGQRQGSVLSALDRTVTTMGARLLQEWLLAPLAEREPIERRLEAVGELAGDSSLREDMRQLLKNVHDLQRLTARVSTGRAGPRDLAALGQSLRLLPRIKAKITARRASLLVELESRLELCPDLRELLDAALVEEPPINSREGGLIKPGYHAELDELRQIARGGKDWIARFQASEIERTGISSLKIGFNQVFGYYIEITHAHISKIPANYQRKQTLKNAERYITPELKEYEEKVLSAEERSQQREHELFLSLRDQVAAQTVRLLQTGETLAQLDVLAALAELAVQRDYTCPKMSDDAVLLIRDGRHPVLDQSLPPGTFVPNDVMLWARSRESGVRGQETGVRGQESGVRGPESGVRGPESGVRNQTAGADSGPLTPDSCPLTPDAGSLWLITGPNMSGKSTFIRQVALLALMAQMGSFVPAAEAEVGLVDRIFTRVGASDELSRGQSTFMVEMTEAANILNNATPRSLVILDEIGRGTSTYDGVSLAWAITEHLHNQVGCRALFATHYHELASLSATLPGLRNYNVLVREWHEDIVFMHKIAAGSADKSYGIHVARLAGVPAEVLDRARQVLDQLETHQLDRELPSSGRRRRKLVPDVQPLLFPE